MTKSQDKLMTDSETRFDTHALSQIIIYGPVKTGTELLIDLQFITDHPEIIRYLGFALKQSSRGCGRGEVTEETRVSEFVVI